jgi:CheY-like chemotaxis protein
MPLVDGFSVLETLANKQGPNHDTPIFVVTADESQQARIRAVRRHAIFLLTKPVHLATLVSLADSALKKAAARATVQPEKPKKN